MQKTLNSGPAVLLVDLSRLTALTDFSIYTWTFNVNPHMFSGTLTRINWTIYYTSQCASLQFLSACKSEALRVLHMISLSMREAATVSKQSSDIFVNRSLLQENALDMIAQHKKHKKIRCWCFCGEVGDHQSQHTALQSTQAKTQMATKKNTPNRYETCPMMSVQFPGRFEALSSSSGKRRKSLAAASSTHRCLCPSPMSINNTISD